MAGEENIQMKKGKVDFCVGIAGMWLWGMSLKTSLLHFKVYDCTTAYKALSVQSCPLLLSS